MKKIIFLTFLFYGLFNSFQNTFADNLKSKNISNWVLINDAEYAVSLLMPSGYKLDEQSNKGLDGEMVYSKTYMKYESNEMFTFTASRYSYNTANMMNNTNPETMLNYAKDRLKNIYHGTISKEGPIQINSCLGKEILIDGKRENVFNRSINRIYWVPPFIYVISYSQFGKNPFVGSIGNFLTKNSEKYLFSLKMNKACNSNTNKLYEDEPIPILSPEDFIIFSDYIAKQNLSSVEIEEYVFSVLSKGYYYLSDEEKNESEMIYAIARNNLSIEEQRNVISIKSRIDSNEKVSIIENSYVNKMFLKMLTNLPKDKLSRLQYLNGKCLRAAISIK